MCIILYHGDLSHNFSGSHPDENAAGTLVLCGGWVTSPGSGKDVAPATVHGDLGVQISHKPWFRIKDRNKFSS